MTDYGSATEKLREIFEDHCNLSGEQYTEIRGRLVYLMADIQSLQEKDGKVTLEEAEEEADQLGVIFEFLLNTKELTIVEYNAVCNLVNGMADAAREAAEGGGTCASAGTGKIRNTASNGPPTGETTT